MTREEFIALALEKFSKDFVISLLLVIEKNKDSVDYLKLAKCLEP